MHGNETTWMEIQAVLNVWSQYWRDLVNFAKAKIGPLFGSFAEMMLPVKDSSFRLFRNKLLKLKFKGYEVGIHIHT